MKINELKQKVKIA